MGYTIVSGNKPSLEVLKNHATMIVLIENVWNKREMLTLNLKWDGAEEPTVNNFYNIDNRK